MMLDYEVFFYFAYIIRRAARNSHQSLVEYRERKNRSTWQISSTVHWKALYPAQYLMFQYALLSLVFVVVCLLWTRLTPTRLIGIRLHGAGSTEKHAFDVGLPWNFRLPGTQISIKRSGSLKHTVHVGHPIHSPPTDILIERICTVKHTAHVPDLRSVKSRDRLIEWSGALEHGTHVRYFRRVPLSNVLIETLCMSEHGGHRNGITGIPITYIFIETKLVGKEPRKVCHFRYAPITDRILVLSESTADVIYNIIPKFRVACIAIPGFLYGRLGGGLCGR